MSSIILRFVIYFGFVALTIQKKSLSQLAFEEYGLGQVLKNLKKNLQGHKSLNPNIPSLRSTQVTEPHYKNDDGNIGRVNVASIQNVNILTDKHLLESLAGDLLRVTDSKATLHAKDSLRCGCKKNKKGKTCNKCPKKSKNNCNFSYRSSDDAEDFVDNTLRSLENDDLEQNFAEHHSDGRCNMNNDKHESGEADSLRCGCRESQPRSVDDDTDRCGGSDRCEGAKSLRCGCRGSQLRSVDDDTDRCGGSDLCGGAESLRCGCKGSQLRSVDDDTHRCGGSDRCADSLHHYEDEQKLFGVERTQNLLHSHSSNSNSDSSKNNGFDNLYSKQNIHPSENSHFGNGLLQKLYSKGKKYKLSDDVNAVVVTLDDELKSSRNKRLDYLEPDETPKI